ncbi:MAG: aminotransferase class III-fold pyridoxal phosphate-dependent enzyme [Paraburkholderia sp.]|uniref:aminotransferase class III-fold pyridoxal phosphate-dependent enzyme n=1 Tax=Paraburkholderia sp. TaxID=1926495 RepID=UPI0010F4D63A
MAREKEVVMHTWCVQTKWDAPTIVGGEGAIFHDDKGRSYLDMSSLAESNNLGHQHPRVVAAIREQAQQLCFVTSEWGAKSRAELAEQLLDVSGFEGGRVFFTLGGADANENAVKFARWASGKPNGKIITRYRSYHGATPSTGALSGDPRTTRQAPGMAEVVHVPPPYCYRCPFGLQYGSCKTRCATHLDDVIGWENADTIAAVLMEPSAGTNGIIAPPEFWPRLRHITKERGIPLIADEVMSGFGRTGRWFAWQKYGDAGRPDMMTLAKGLTGGHLPLGAVIVSAEISRRLENQMLYTGLTYGGHPLCCAAGLAAVQSYAQEQLIPRAEDLGAVLRARLVEMKRRYRVIGDVRGEGLFMIVEFVSDRDTATPLTEWGGTSALLRRLVDNGRAVGVSFGVRSNLVILAPPLNITEEQLHHALDVLDGLIGECETQVHGINEEV